jgi:hypothetical protein
MEERGATPAEVRSTIRTGSRNSAKLSRTVFHQTFAVSGTWRGRAYSEKEIEVYAVGRGKKWLAITVIVKYRDSSCS